MLIRRPPFPGMDPWLERASFWPDFHNRLITAIADKLSSLVGARYFVGMQEHVYAWTGPRLRSIGLPDAKIVGPVSRRPSKRSKAKSSPSDAESTVVELSIPPALMVPESYVEIVEIERRRVVTIIEVLSPSNKRHPLGRRKYLRKRNRVLESRTNLIEVDLMRAGKPLPYFPEGSSHDYRILVRRGITPETGTAFLFSYKAPVPTVPVPLARPDPDVDLELTDVLHALVDRARYYLVTDYEVPPEPALRDGDVAWAASIVGQAKRRPPKRPTRSK